MHRQVILIICLIIEATWLKKCEKDTSLAVVIDSTKETTPDDFNTQVAIIKEIVHAVNSSGGKIIYNVHVYSGREITCHNSGLNVKMNIPINLPVQISTNLKISDIRHENSSKTYNLNCANSILKRTMEDLSKNSDNVVGLILAKYESVKKHIPKHEHSKYDQDGLYFLALVYDPSDSTISPVKKYARRLSHVFEIVRSVLDLICPGEFASSQIRELIAKTSGLNSMTDIQMGTISSSFSVSSSQYGYQTEVSPYTIYISPSIAPESVHSKIFTPVVRNLMPNSTQVYSTTFTSSLDNSMVVNFLSKSSFTTIINSSLIIDRTVHSSSFSIPKKDVNYTSVIDKYGTAKSSETLVMSNFHPGKKEVNSDFVQQYTISNSFESLSVFKSSRPLTSSILLEKLHSETTIETEQTSKDLVTSHYVSSSRILNESVTDYVEPVHSSAIDPTSFLVEPSLSKRQYATMVEPITDYVQPTINISNIFSDLVSVNLSLRTSFISMSPSYLLHTKEKFTTNFSPLVYESSTVNKHVNHSRNWSAVADILSSLPTIDYSYTEVVHGSFINTSIISFSQSYLSSIYNSSVLFVNSLEKIIKDINFIIKQNVSKEELEDLITNTTHILSEIEKESSEIVYKPSLKFIYFVEETVLKIGKELSPGENISISTDEVDILLSSVNPETFSGYAFSPSLKANENIPNGTPGESLQLPSTLFKNISGDYKKVSIMSVFMKIIPAMRRSKGNFRDIGKLFTISLDVQLEYPMEKPLFYSFNVPKNNFSNYKCVFWNSSDWDTEGCYVANISGSQVSCECTHMTSFSILMQVSDFEMDEKHKYALSIITYIGCGASILGCVLLMLTYFMCGRLLKVSRNIIHTNLAFAIAISNALFISADSVHVKGLCLGISIAMLYAYLASFFWMLVEGIHVYLMIVKVFKSPQMMKGYLIIGWVIPAVIVTVAALKFHVSFTRDDFCWISVDGNVIWIFVGPVLLIVSINIVILIRALTTSYKMAVSESDFLKLQQIARLTMLLMPIFGVTWILGVLAVNKQLIIFQYIFTIINSFQGVFIFICYCLLNNEVKQEYERIKRKYQYSAGPSSTTESSVSVYNQLFTPRRMKSVLSMDSSANVRLTRYDSVSNPESGTLTSSYGSDTLTKRLKKDYSVELVSLHENPNKEERDSGSSLIDEDNQDCSLKTYEDLPRVKWYAGDEPDNDISYDTFKKKKNVP